MTVLEITTLLTAILGAATGIAGLLLGIVNHRHQVRQSPTAIRVVPQLAFRGPMDEMICHTHMPEEAEDSLGSAPTYLGIEVMNQSATPKTIFEVGLIAENGTRTPWRYPHYVEPDREFPITLQPGEKVSAYLRIRPPDFGILPPAAYARTDCGEQFQGTSPVLDDLVRKHQVPEVGS